MYLDLAMYINSLPKTTQLYIYLGSFIFIAVLIIVYLVKNIQEE